VRVQEGRGWRGEGRGWRDKVNGNGEREGDKTAREQSAASEGNKSSGRSIALGEVGDRHKYRMVLDFTVQNLDNFWRLIARNSQDLSGYLAQ
jgi:hypothetical protein